MSGAVAAPSFTFTEPTTEAELLALMPEALKDTKLGLALVLLEACIYHGWTSAIPTLAASKICPISESSKLQLLETSMHSNDYEEETSIKIWNMLTEAWPDVIEKNWDYLTVKSFEIAPLVVWKQMLDRLKSIIGGNMVGYLEMFQGAGKSPAHKDAMQEAIKNAPR